MSPSILAATQELNHLLGKWRLDRILPEVTPDAPMCAEQRDENFSVRIKVEAIGASDSWFGAYEIDVILEPVWSRAAHNDACRGRSLFAGERPEQWAFYVALVGQNYLLNAAQRLNGFGEAIWKIPRSERFHFTHIKILEPIMEPGFVPR